MASRMPGLFSPNAFLNAPRIVRHRAFQRSWQRRHPTQSLAAGRRAFTSQQEQGARGSRYDVTGTTVVLTLIVSTGSTQLCMSWVQKQLTWKVLASIHCVADRDLCIGNMADQETAMEAQPHQ